jgi:septation ring formation regulator EzrA
MSRSQRGNAVTVVLVLVGLVVVVFIALFAFSDVFRTKTKSAWEELTEWTPEQIAKDPVNYLNFCEEKTKDAMQKLKATEISIRQKQGTLRGMKEKHANQVRVGEQALAELKTIYKDAEAAGSWPATWRGESRDRAFVRKQIVSIDREVQGQQGILTKVEAGLKKLDVQIMKVQDQRAKCQEQLAEIATNREMLKVQEITDDLANQLAEMQGLLQASIVTATESDSLVSLSDLTAEEATTVDDSEFDAIMNR